MFKLLKNFEIIPKPIPFNMDYTKPFSKNCDPSDILTPACILNFKNIGAEVRPITLFNSPGNFKQTVHMDSLFKIGGRGAVNIITGPSADWTMQWFDLTQDLKLINHIVPSTGNSALIVKNNDDQLTLATELKNINFQPVLVRTDVPHRVLNSSNLNRLCMSIRFFNNSIDYEQLSQIFS